MNRMPKAVYKASSANNPHWNRKLRFWFMMLLVILIAITARYFWQQTANKHRVPPQAVVVAQVRTANVPVYLSALGSVTPKYSITVRTQVNGQLLNVLFREGQMVKKGDLLAQIDPRPFQAQMLQYQGQLLRDGALLDNANLDLNRYQTLWKQDSVAKQVLDTQKALVKQYQGAVKIDQGLIEATQLNLVYASITSPVDGRIGFRLVDPGNYVQTTDTTGLAIIDTLSPINIVFTIPEDAIPQVMEQAYAGKALKVEAYDRTQHQLLSTGSLLTIDNQIDPTTGTVKLKAEFANKDFHLFSNQFVNVELLVKTLNNAIIVPTAAVQMGPDGTFVYVLNANKTVSVKAVTTGITFGTDTTITKGITMGESVVVQGVDRLSDGARVVIAKNNTTRRKAT